MNDEILLVNQIIGEQINLDDLNEMSTENEDNFLKL